MLKNISLIFKLSLPPAVALIGLLLFVAYTAFQLDNNDVRLVTLEERSYPTLENADAVIFHFSRVPGLLNNAVSAGEMGTFNDAQKVLTEIGVKQRMLQNLTQEQPQRNEELIAWIAAVKRYTENAFSATELLLKGAAFEDLRPSLDRMASDLDQAQKAGDLFRSHAYEDFHTNLTDTRTENVTTTRVGYGLSIILALLVSIGSAIVIHRVMSNIHGVITSLRSIASGDGDLTRRVNVETHDEIGVMIKLFNSFLDKLQVTMRQIIEAAGPLEQMSKDLYRLTQDTEENARSQEGHTDSISRDISAMTQSIQEVAHRSQRASEEAAAASTQAETARHNIDNLSSSISDLGGSVLGSVQAMQQLEEETQQVGSVLTVIRSIAEQTNLLALNAAIEAARAGEQGRGFAVVADEVRNLAQKTAISTAEIQTIIQRLQLSANGVLNVMTLNGEKAEANIKRSVEATHTLEVIAKSVRQIDVLNAGIAQFTQEQISLSKSIQNDTEVLQRDTQTTTLGADAIARLGEQLVSTGNDLRTSTAIFRV